MVVSKDGPRPYWVHLIWTLYFFINIMMFWWWEFRLGTLDWSLWLYLVVVVYATLFFFISLVVQPGNPDGVSDYKAYYYSRRRWIFGLLIAVALWDFVDTAMKGIDHFLSLSIEYLVFQATLICAAIVAIATANERYHEIFTSVWIVVFIAFMFHNFLVIS